MTSAGSQPYSLHFAVRSVDDRMHVGAALIERRAEERAGRQFDVVDVDAAAFELGVDGLAEGQPRDRLARHAHRRERERCAEGQDPRPDVHGASILLLTARPGTRPDPTLPAA
jgi:hypothetical protein